VKVKATVEIARLVEEGKRQAEIESQRWEAQREQWRRQEEARRAAKALKDSKEELLQVIDSWAEAKRLEAFFADAERRAQDLPDEQRERTVERHRRARALIGSTDALERFNVWRAPEERQNRPEASQEVRRSDLGCLWGHFRRLA